MKNSNEINILTQYWLHTHLIYIQLNINIFFSKKKKIYIYNKELVLKECASDEKINNNNLNYNCGTFIEIKFVLEKKNQIGNKPVTYIGKNFASQLCHSYSYGARLN